MLNIITKKTGFPKADLCHGPCRLRLFHDISYVEKGSRYRKLLKISIRTLTAFGMPFAMQKTASMCKSNFEGNAVGDL